MKQGVLLMAHGSPDRPEQVGDYLARVMTRRAPTPEFIEEIAERYRLIGGRSPLLDITRAQAAALAKRLDLPVYVGMRHWTPFISEAVEQAKADDIERLVAIPLAPQTARVSVGAYEAAFKATGFPGVVVQGWHMEPSLLRYWKSVAQEREFVLFTAHSIPVKDAQPYPAQLEEMVAAIAQGPHAFAYQSRSPSPVPWLEPSVEDVLPSLKGRISVAAIGFVCDHVEVLYDLDILHRGQAEAAGLQWDRLPMPNDDPLLVDALASVAGKYL